VRVFELLRTPANSCELLGQSDLRVFMRERLGHIGDFLRAPANSCKLLSQSTHTVLNLANNKRRPPSLFKYHYELLRTPGPISARFNCHVFLGTCALSLTPTPTNSCELLSQSAPTFQFHYEKSHIQLIRLLKLFYKILECMYVVGR
jgi:hypothetical protein